MSVMFTVYHASIGLALCRIGDLGLETAARVVAWVARDSGLWETSTMAKPKQGPVASTTGGDSLSCFGLLLLSAQA